VIILIIATEYNAKNFHWKKHLPTLFSYHVKHLACQILEQKSGWKRSKSWNSRLASYNNSLLHANATVQMKKITRLKI